MRKTEIYMGLTGILIGLVGGGLIARFIDTPSGLFVCYLLIIAGLVFLVLYFTNKDNIMMNIIRNNMSPRRKQEMLKELSSKMLYGIHGPGDLLGL